MTDDIDVADVSPADTFRALEGEANASLVDVRTRAEWAYVGLPIPPDTDRLKLIEWQTFPAMDVAGDFGAALRAECPDPSGALYFICRSGARSLAAARLARSLGYERCFNVEDGFEGPPDSLGHRGTVAGWKASGLPWRQT